MFYGRDRERAGIRELLEAARSSRSGSLVLRGEVAKAERDAVEEAKAAAELLLVPELAQALGIAGRVGNEGVRHLRHSYF